MLNDRDCERIYKLVYSQHRSIAVSAGSFVNDRLFRMKSSDCEKIQLTARGKKRSPNTPLFRDLIQFFIESELHEHATYLVDSLIATNDMLKDWECMTDLLLEEPGPGEESLDNRQESVLIDIMSSAVQQTATGEHPVGRSVKGAKNKPKTVADKKQLEIEQNKITDHFIHTLPRLLLKYKADDLKLVDLLEIPLHFRLKNYTQFVYELEELLKLINEAVDIHVNGELLLKCAQIYEHLYDEHFAFHRSVWSAKIFLLDSLFHRKYLPLVNSYDTSNSSLIPSNLTAILKKLAVFASCHDMSSYDLWTNVFQRWIMPQENDHHHHKHDIYSTPCEILIQSISVTFYNFLWDLHNISKSMSRTSGRIFRSRLLPTKTRLTQFIKCLSQLLTHEREDVNIEAYSCLCDLLIIFGKGLTDTVGDSNSESLADLVYKPSIELATRIESFVINKVYTYPQDDPMDEISIADAEQIQQLYTRRHILAGFCKLIVCSVIPMRFAYHPFKYYTQFSNDYGDIVKTLLNRMRKMNREICTKIMERANIKDFRTTNCRKDPI
ncbi:cohesin subunit SA-1-like [Brevipalpus obovatus]|uniref:cohesin subunit SA-1-like n=1 Tax=Brevipalpus obovatus TaxID=246614 RepID=UPI003D9F5DF4